MAASVDVSQVAQHVAVTQDLRIQPIVGTLVYEQLQDAVVAGTPTPKQRELLRRLRASLAYWTLAAALPTIASRTSGAGVVRVESGNTKPADSADVTQQVAQAENTAEFYATRAVAYLRENRSDFPDWPGDGSDMGGDMGGQYTGGFAFPDSGCRNCDLTE